MLRKTWVSLVLICLVALAAFKFLKPSKPGELRAINPTVHWEKTYEGVPVGLAKADFRLQNIGGSPVRIREVESGCGCATPKIQRKELSPGEETIISVESTVMPLGERTVKLKVLCDSPVTPEIPLVLQTSVRRTPPFILKANGSLNYPEASPGDIRKISIVGIVNASNKVNPILTTPFPYMEFHLASEQEQPYEDLALEGVVQKTWVYHAQIRSGFPKEWYSDIVQVIDPWNKSVVAELPLSVSPQKNIQIVPSRLVLGTAPGSSSTVRLIVVSKIELKSVEIVPEEPAAPLSIKATNHDASGKRWEFTVTLAPNSKVAANQVFHLVARPTPDPGEKLLVPVLIQK